MGYIKSCCWLIFLTFAFSCQQESSKKVATGSNMNAKEIFKWAPDRLPMISAHRGGSYPGFPENCIETFNKTLSYTNALIECDINTTLDGHLVLMHDDKVDRTTNGSGYVDEMKLADIKTLKLRDNNGNTTDFHVPTLREVIKWAKEEEVIVNVDVKRGVNFEKVIKLIEQNDAENYFVIIVYTVENALKVYRLNPSLMLSMAIRNREEFERVKKAGIPKENLIAFTGIRLLSEEFYTALHEEGVYCILGTFGNLDRRAVKRGDHLYRDFINKGVDIIATDRPREVAGALDLLN